MYEYYVLQIFFFLTNHYICITDLNSLYRMIKVYKRLMSLLASLFNLIHHKKKKKIGCIEKLVIKITQILNTIQKYLLYYILNGVMNIFYYNAVDFEPSNPVFGNLKICR